MSDFPSWKRRARTVPRREVEPAALVRRLVRGLAQAPRVLAPLGLTLDRKALRVLARALVRRAGRAKARRKARR